MYLADSVVATLKFHTLQAAHCLKEIQRLRGGYRKSIASTETETALQLARFEAQYNEATLGLLATVADIVLSEVAAPPAQIIFLKV